MKEYIKKALVILRRGKVRKDYVMLEDGSLIETIENTFRSIEREIRVCLISNNVKKVQECWLNELEEYNWKNLKKCNLLVFSKGTGRDIPMERFRFWVKKSCVKNHYEGIVACTATEIFVFPQLKYQDIYLIKNIVRNACKSEADMAMMGSTDWIFV